MLATVLLLIVMMLGSSVLCWANAPQQGQVEGDVIQVFPTAIVIRDDRGHATVLQLNPRTQVADSLKPGDKVIASITPYGVTSVQLKPSVALIP
jgi:hypothetical protein